MKWPIDLFGGFWILFDLKLLQEVLRWLFCLPSFSCGFLLLVYALCLDFGDGGYGVLESFELTASGSCYLGFIFSFGSCSKFVGPYHVSLPMDIVFCSYLLVLQENLKFGDRDLEKKLKEIYDSRYVFRRKS